MFLAIKKYAEWNKVKTKKALRHPQRFFKKLHKGYIFGDSLV